MFDQSDLKTETIGGVKHITFHPNTILYAIPTGTPLAKQIAKAKVGIVWHTSYSGGTFETMRAEFGKDITSKLKSSTNVWQVDATLKDLSGTATLPDGSTVSWVKDETAETITLTVTAADGSLTQLVVPVGDFKF